MKVTNHMDHDTDFTSSRRLRYWTHRNRLIGYFALAIVLRIILYVTLPVFTTNDSWDYLLASEDIYWRFDFLSGFLRDTRLPGYPVFLALVHPITLMQADRILVAQTILGLASMVLGLWIGRILGSRLAAEVLVIFLGFNPYFLLNEHALMTETWYLFVLLAFTALTLLAVRDGFTAGVSMGIGITAAAIVLTRANVLPFCVVIIVGAVALRVILHRGGASFVNGVYAHLRAILILGAVFAILVVPWLWRNYQLYDTWTFVNFTNRNLLVWKAMHGDIDYTLPQISQVNDLLEMKKVDFVWLWKTRQVYDANQIERISNELWLEQIRAQPITHLSDIGEALLGYAGIYDNYGDDRTAVRVWFSLIPELAQIQKLNRVSDEIATRTSYTYVERGIDSWINDWWSAAALLYMTYLRPVFLLGFTIIFFGYLLAVRRIQGAAPLLYRDTVLLLGAGYWVMAAVHAITLTDGDRYALMFDWIPILLVVLVSETIFAYNRRISQTPH